MTKRVHTVTPSQTLMEAAFLLAEFHIRQLPVLDSAGAMVGSLDRSDVKRALGDALEI